jgi:sterol desaturase/sphingolipid hydroxylase (fatty acid hydroxylase superfamily)
MLVFGGTCVAVIDAGLPPQLVTGALGLPIVIWVASLERILPYRRDWNQSHGDLQTDLLHLVFSATAVQQLMAALLMSLTAWIQVRFGFSSAALWPTHWPLAMQLLFAFLLCEIFLYGLHRAEHESPWLWPLHAVHHSASRLYWMNSTRFHPLDEVLLAAAGFTPLMLLGCPPEVTAIAATLAGVNSAFKHANIDVKLGPLNYVVSMAELHRVHHAQNPEQSNGNYGGNLLLWDLLFRTFRLPEATEGPASVGLGDASPIVPPDYASQVAYPFVQWARLSQSDSDATSSRGAEAS